MIKRFNNFINELYRNPYNNPNEIWDKEIDIKEFHNGNLSIKDLNATLKDKFITFYSNNGKKYEHYKFKKAKKGYKTHGYEDDTYDEDIIILKIYKKGLEIDKKDISNWSDNYYYSGNDKSIEIYKDKENIMGVKIDMEKSIKIEN